MQRPTVSRTRSVFSNLLRLYLLVPLVFLVGLLPIAGHDASPSADAASIPAIDAANFVPQRHCKSPLPAGVVEFTGGTGAQLATTVNTLPSDSTLVIYPAASGEYVVTVEMAITGKHDITICGAPGTRPKIKQTSNAWRIFTVGNSSNITIEGLEIYSIYDANHDQVSGVQAIEGAHHVYIWDMWVHDVPACGVCSARSAGHNDFRYNRIWKTAGYSRYNQSGISLFNNRNGGGGPNDGYGYSDYLIGNLVWASQKLSGRTTDGNCIIMDNNNGVPKVPAYTGRTLIANNLCVANGGRGIHMLASDNIHVVNNTLYHDLRGASARGGGLDQHQGEISVYNSSNLRIINNLSVAIPYGNVYDTGSTGTNVALAGNAFSGPTSRHPTGGFTTIPSPTGMFVRPTEDPLDPLMDFHLQAGWSYSKVGVPRYPLDPASDSATNPRVVIPTVDFKGDPRELGTVGAFAEST